MQMFLCSFADAGQYVDGSLASARCVLKFDILELGTSLAPALKEPQACRHNRNLYSCFGL